MQRYPMTPQGKLALEKELHQLKNKPESFAFKPAITSVIFFADSSLDWIFKLSF